METYIAAFITLVVIIDPPGMAPIFAGLTDGASKKFKRTMAIKGSFIALLILLFFGWAGQPFMNALGISIDGLRVAGGIMLFIIALEMVMEKRTERKQEAAEKLDDYFEDISVFPIALPLLAGPGSIATIMILMNNQEGNLMGQVMVMSALLSVIFLTLIALLIAPQMMALLGPSVNAVITRVLGVVLAALAAQYVLEGVQGFYAF
ncbi:MarC family protein [Temperatibacter marinus]|uniref:UPF0056 membrane protein n=1 Tax=Temperatibacter marinus TaxID=1456591 RepID=A0AA52EIN1_9PROT|nr:MarC family protein [Temperatibacter marinus]WND03237.1 MarC family protein [Temperatibacter marinus]